MQFTTTSSKMLCSCVSIESAMFALKTSISSEPSRKSSTAFSWRRQCYQQTNRYMLTIANRHRNECTERITTAKTIRRHIRDTGYTVPLNFAIMLCNPPSVIFTCLNYIILCTVVINMFYTAFSLLTINT